MTEAERRASFNEIYAQYERRVFAYCLYVLSDRDRANDVFQEVFIKTYQSLHTLRDADKTSNWLFRIARNECLNAMKSVQRSERRSVPIDDPDADYAVSTSGVTYSDEGEHLRWGLAQLSKDHREALLLAEFEGFSLKEIADMTGTSLSNVKVRIHRAKQKLHTILQPILNDYD
jgi:RNA polymerase sigma-70 factor, ECF subfamily